ncbi:MAG: nitrate reductase molybdenum cofactor assembly chaperone, partial [Porticoccaceae bacterium]
MDSLKLIARLLDYPDAQVQAHINELCEVVVSSAELSSDLKDSLLVLIDEIYGGDLLDAQENYTHVFDYGRALSLLLFEHVHGESRDRGQAMVDLMALYEANGFAINVRELPDYIPLYLEYLSHRPEAEARDGLADIAHILGLLCARLRQRSSNYEVLFEA